MMEGRGGIFSLAIATVLRLLLASAIPMHCLVIVAMSASQLSAAIKQQQISCVEVMHSYLDRIHRYNPVYNAIVSMASDDALLQQAGLADAALSKGEYWGWMHGMPRKDLFYQQLGIQGPLGRNAEDPSRLLQTMAGYDPRAPLSRRDTMPAYDGYRASELAGYRIGWMGDYDGYLAMEPGVLDLCQSALGQITGAGAIVENCKPAYDMARLWQTWLTLRHWAMTDAQELYNKAETRSQLKPEFTWEIEGSFDMPASRVATAGADRSDWYRALLSLFDSYDILALPTAQVFPFSKDIHWPKSIDGRPMDTYHRWMEVVIGGTLGGLPVVNLPAGFDSAGRPMGMQFIGRMGEDQRVLEFALAYENSTEFLRQRPVLQS